MRNVLKKVVLALLLLPIVVVLISFLLPARFRVDRSTMIQATPADIYPYLSNLHHWPEWTPWNTNREPTLVFSYSGPVEGAGAVQSWTASSGNGSIRLISSHPDEGVRYELNFIEGRLILQGAIAMTAEGTRTRVTWSTEGELGKNPVGRYLGLLMGRWMGADFEAGLSTLKAKVESVPK